MALTEMKTLSSFTHLLPRWPFSRWVQVPGGWEEVDGEERKNRDFALRFSGHLCGPPKRRLVFSLSLYLFRLTGKYRDGRCQAERVPVGPLLFLLQCSKKGRNISISIPHCSLCSGPTPPDCCIQFWILASTITIFKNTFFFLVQIQKEGRPLGFRIQT